VFDLDGSRYISRSEMESVLSAFRSGPVTKETLSHLHDVVNDIFRKADLNLDQQISLAEFLRLAEVPGLTLSFNREFARAFGLDWSEHAKPQ
jgi:Ca2+-binding EF-hand superfamily protein